MSPHFKVCVAVIVLLSLIAACGQTETLATTPPPTPTLVPSSPTPTQTPVFPAGGSESEAPDLPGLAPFENAYLGLEPPGKNPVVFAPGIISVDANFEHSAAVFSPDNREVYWSTNVNWYTDERVVGDQRLLYMRMNDGEWTPPQIAPFAEVIHTPIQRTVFSPDGGTIYFETYSDQSLESDMDIFVVERIGEGWSEPVPVSPFVNSPAIERLHCVGADGSLYFSRNPFTNNEEIFVSKLVDGAFAEPEELGASYNSAGYELAILIGPEEEYMLIESTDDQRSSFLTVSYKKADGSWTDRIKTHYECGGFLALSPDGEYLFFLGERGIYWVDTSFIGDLKPSTL